MADDKPGDVARFWIGQIQTAQRGKVAGWHERGDKIIRRFKDEKDEGQALQIPQRHKMNLLWSNVETMKPTVYAKTPKPNIQRRNKDRDPIGRWASIALERCVAYCLSAQDFDYTMRSCVSDYLLPGRATVCEEYDPVISGKGDEQKLEWERTKTRYIHWKDFLTNPARTWDEVWWGAYRTFETRAQVEAFMVKTGTAAEEAKTVANSIPMKHTVDDTSPKTDDTGEDNKRAIVWCIWSKRDRKVIYVVEGYPDRTLFDGDPPIKLDDFFNFPRPMTTTTATDSILPVPDFAQYQDQADEIDLMTQRINMLMRALKITGAYDANNPALAQMLNDSNDNTLIPVDTWAYFAEKGGLKGAVDFFPIDMVAKTLTECIAAREQSKQALYEITGISDIVRGASDAGETATAQQIKSQWGSLRIRDRQAEVQRFARDIVRIKCEVIAEQFADDVIKKMSGVKLLTQAEKQQAMQIKQAAEAGDPQAIQIAQQAMQAMPELMELMNEPTWDEVLALLRSDKLRGFSIDIETDSTIQPDEMQERQAAVEFTTAVGGLLTGAAPIVQQQPALMPLFTELLLHTVRRFKVGETMETTIEQTFEAVQKQLAQPKPDPEQQKQQAEVEALKAKTQADIEGQQARAAADIEIKKQGAVVDMEMKRAELEHKTKLAGVDMQMEQQRAQQKADADGRIAQQNADTKNEIAGMRSDYAVKSQNVTGQTGEMLKSTIAPVAEGFQQSMQSLADGLTAMAQAIAQQGADMKAGLGELARAQMAEQELVRDKTGRAVGSRRKAMTVQ